MSRQQRHEIIKYVRSRLPIFLVQTHQLLQNIMYILANLTDDEKTKLVVFLVPEVSGTILSMLYQLIYLSDDHQSDQSLPIAGLRHRGRN